MIGISVAGMATTTLLMKPVSSLGLVLTSTSL